MGKLQSEARDDQNQHRISEKTKDMLEYVIVHELIHLIAPRLTAAFFGHLDRLYPNWQVIRAELNDLPLATYPS